MIIIAFTKNDRVPPYGLSICWYPIICFCAILYWQRKSVCALDTIDWRQIETKFNRNIAFEHIKLSTAVINLSSTIPRPLQNILPHQPELPNRIFHDHLTKRQLAEVGLFNPLLQIVTGIGFIRNVPPRLQNRQRFGSTTRVLNKPYFFKGGFAIVVWL